MTFSTADHPLVVVGAGIGGLSAAVRLAARGHIVHVYEQQSYVGGKVNEIRADGFRWGWMLGAGAERALSSRWSLKGEYDFLAFGDAALTTPVGFLQPVASPDPNAVTPVASTSTDFSSTAHLVKIGLNYRLGNEATIADAVPVCTPCSWDKTSGSSFGECSVSSSSQSNPEYATASAVMLLQRLHHRPI